MAKRVSASSGTVRMSRKSLRVKPTLPAPMMATVMGVLRAPYLRAPPAGREGARIPADLGFRKQNVRLACG